MVGQSGQKKNGVNLGPQNLGFRVSSDSQNPELSNSEVRFEIGLHIRLLQPFLSIPAQFYLVFFSPLQHNFWALVLYCLTRLVNYASVPRQSVVVIIIFKQFHQSV